VQLRLPWTEGAATPPELVVFVRHRRARRYILRVLSDGTLRVTLPRWGHKREAHAFVEANRDWIAKQRDDRRRASPPPQDWGDGTGFLLDGAETTIRLESGCERIHLWQEAHLLAAIEHAGSIRSTVERWMRERAAAELPGALLALAAVHDIDVARVSVRNQQSRWGACSPSGTITLNWRLLQAPPYVREYVLLHELMHRREMNHSRRFWRLVAACCPRHQEARLWLRTEGKSLWPVMRAQT